MDLYDDEFHLCALLDTTDTTHSIDNERELGNQTLVKRMQDKMRRDIAKLYTDWRKCFAASR